MEGACWQCSAVGIGFLAKDERGEVERQQAMEWREREDKLQAAVRENREPKGEAWRGRWHGQGGG